MYTSHFFKCVLFVYLFVFLTLNILWFTQYFLYIYNFDIHKINSRAIQGQTVSVMLLFIRFFHMSVNVRPYVSVTINCFEQLFYVDILFASASMNLPVNINSCPHKKATVII